MVMSQAAWQLDAIPADDHVSDEAVVARVRDGESAQFALLVRRHNQRLFRAARAILPDDQEAEDALQQGYIQAFRHLDQFRGESSVATWLTRIVVRVALSRVRGRQRRAVLGVIGPVDAEARDVSDGARNPEDHAAAHQLGRLLERHIDALPDGYRAVFVLRDIEELPTAETAACLGISEEAVRVRLHRARAMLKEALSEVLDTATAQAFHFAGARCNRVVLSVMNALIPVGSPLKL
jgi:RNA polymerase sigma-70 factor (ECF subfamily)